MTPEIKNIIDTWAKDTQTRILKNLESRKVVGQPMLVKKISFDLQTSGDQYALVFTFERQKQKVFKNKQTEKLEINDPLFQKHKLWERGEREISFVRKANVFELLKGRYFLELVAEVAKIDAEAAAKLTIQTLNTLG